MNFFAHQEQARRQTRRLVFLFGLAVLTIVVVLNVVLLVTLGMQSDPFEHLDGFILLTVCTLLLIGGASMYRVASLRQGGGVVAQAMGATLVPPDTLNPQWRRLRNVVEEIALAAGTPTPQVYVMAQETGINAFAAGYAPTDAAVAVTQGCLDTLNREELQGVIAHEFSHIRNGDMRLNIRLMGVLFGILVLGVLGRLLLRGGMRGGMRSRNSRNGGGQGVVIGLGLALVVVGYTGVFFGRLIKAGVSRQREFLSDASAVQFTRNPRGVSGALKKIGALAGGSRLMAPDTEEVSHMLFANGVSSFTQWLATHPPLDKRIRAIEPGFDPSEFARVRKEMQARLAQDEAPSEAPVAVPRHATMLGGALPGTLITAAVLADLAAPDEGQLAQAAELIRSLPAPLLDAAHEIDGAVAVLLLLLLGDAPDEQMRRFAAVRDRITDAVAARLKNLLPLGPGVQPAQRLPLLQLAFPALRQRAPEALADLPALAEQLIHFDGRVSVFEYAIGRLLTDQVRDALQPRDARPGGSMDLRDVHEAARDLLGVLAAQGHADEAQARAAWTAGMARLAPEGASANAAAGAVADGPAAVSTADRTHGGTDDRWQAWRGNWAAVLDEALPVLDGLTLMHKPRLIEAMVATMLHDGEVTLAEAELLRTVCACLHVPLPAWTPPATPSSA